MRLELSLCKIPTTFKKKHSHLSCCALETLSKWGAIKWEKNKFLIPSLYLVFKITFYSTFDIDIYYQPVCVQPKAPRLKHEPYILFCDIWETTILIAGLSAYISISVMQLFIMSTSQLQLGWHIQHMNLTFFFVTSERLSFSLLGWVFIYQSLSCSSLSCVHSSCSWADTYLSVKVATDRWIVDLHTQLEGHLSCHLLYLFSLCQVQSLFCMIWCGTPYYRLHLLHLMFCTMYN